ncbi:amino acid ABC transporter ATP-binding protein [Roseomonas sp. CCTCC AB2023176]|uniref:amino acid ABC transporter ATP-binding protein n=1 Tax=Roseomonas sp. CCTCC AB2023176 TaxID=3342640 RepID=UPI0035DE156E
MTAFLRVDSVRRQVGETLILDGIALDVARGEVVGIIGPSGSGKSSLLRCIAGLDTLTAGRVTVEGREPRPGDGTVGMVFQQFNLWPHLTARENVALALRLARRMSKAEAASRADAMLDRVGLRSLADRRPAQLSGGQQQRVAIARTLAVEPRIILFDEPTASLDPELTTEVLEVIRALAEAGQTMLVVSHEMGFVANVASRAIFLDHGKKLVDGPARAVFGKPEEPRLRRFLSTYLQRVTWAAEPEVAPPSTTTMALLNLPTPEPANFALLDAAAPSPAPSFPLLDGASRKPADPPNP